MLIEDSDNFYNTEEKEYIDYDDASSYKKL
jgi:hypothetical protein